MIANRALACLLLTSGIALAQSANPPQPTTQPSEAILPGDDPGEFDIPLVMPLSPPQLQALRELAADDAEAAAIAQAVAARAAGFLDDEPQPLKVIHYEGLVNTNPKRIATVARLRDMTKVAVLMRHWQLTGDAKTAAALRRFIRAWSGTYKLTGNDVNENKFYPMLVAYHALRDTFEPSERQPIDAWVERLGKLHVEAVAKSDHLTNRYTKHVRLAAICGLILDEDAWLAVARKGIQRFVRESLFADGTSRDLRRRDTLTYHGSALKPMIELCILLGEDGERLYRWQNEDGGSIAKSVDYVVPYAKGEKTRQEWRNSKIDLDRRRAEAGLEKYRAGRLYEPKNALQLMELASYFDENLNAVVLHLADSDAERFPAWQSLVNAAVTQARQPAD